MTDKILSAGLGIWPILTIIASVIYIFIKFLNKRNNKYESNKFDLYLLICTIIDFVMIAYLIIIVKNGEFCPEPDIGCMIIVPIFGIIIFNFLFRTFIYCLFYNFELKTSGIKPKINPMFVWFIILILTIGIPILYIEISSKFTYSNVADKQIDVVYLDSIDDLPDDNDDYTLFDVDETAAEDVYNNFNDYKGKKIKLVGYTYNIISYYSNKTDFYFFPKTSYSELLNSTYDYDYEEFFDGKYNYRVSFTLNNTIKNNSDNNMFLYTVVYGKIYSKEQIDNDWARHFSVDVNPSKVYIIKNKYIDYSKE